jgi:AraC-like DNA-binding protein
MKWIVLIENSMAITGIVNCMAIAIFLLFTKNGFRETNKLLSLLLFILSIKLSYTLFINHPHEWTLYSWLFLFISQSAYFSLGPILYLYYNATFRNNVNLWVKYVIFVPTIIPFLYPVFVYDGNFILAIMQSWFLFWLILIFRQLNSFRIEQRNKKNKAEMIWLYTFYIGFCFFWFIVNLLFLDFFFELSIVFTLAFYMVIFITVKHYWYKKGDDFEPQKYKRSGLTEEKELEIFLKLKESMETEKIYIDPEISLPKVASRINVSPHKLSLVINKRLEMTFNDYINSYRVNDIKDAMKKEEYQKTKIASLAYDYGFNSISTFNTAFKKITNYTPLEYRNTVFVSNQN